MANLVKAGFGIFLIFLAVIIRSFVFTQEFLQNIFGLDVNEAYNLIEKIKTLDIIVFIIIIGVGILFVVWGLQE